MQTHLTGQGSETLQDFRLLFGHDCLAKNLYRTGLFPYPYSTLCDQREGMEQNHLLRCPALPEISESKNTGGKKPTG
jgi:hypothetical protein